MKLSHTKEKDGKSVTLEISCRSYDELRFGSYTIEAVYFDGKDVTAYLDQFPDALEDMFEGIDWGEEWASYRDEFRNQLSAVL